MSVERLDYLLKQGVQVPSIPTEVSEFAVKLVVMNLAWHSDIDGYVWVSDRTQERELAMSRSTVFSARQLLVSEKWLIPTGQRKQRGVYVYKLVIPNYVPSGLAIQTTKETSGLGSGSTSGLGSGSGSGLASGLPSGSTSGLFCGLPYPTEKERKEFETKENEISKTKENNLSVIPENVQELIKQNKRSRGIYGEQNLGEAVRDIFENIQPPKQQDQEPF